MSHFRCEDGSTLVELALLLPVFILVLAGIANYAFWIEEKIQLQEAAAAGAAYATIPGNGSDVTGMIAAARAASPQFNVAMTVTAVNTYSCSPGGAAVASTATCSGLSAGPLLFAQVKTSATEFPVLKYLGMPTSMTMQGYASYEVVP